MEYCHATIVIKPGVETYCMRDRGHEKWDEVDGHSMLTEEQITAKRLRETQTKCPIK